MSRADSSKPHRKTGRGWYQERWSDTEVAPAIELDLRTDGVGQADIPLTLPWLTAIEMHPGRPFGVSCEISDNRVADSECVEPLSVQTVPFILDQSTSVWAPRLQPFPVPWQGRMTPPVVRSCPML